MILHIYIYIYIYIERDKKKKIERERERRKERKREGEKRERKRGSKKCSNACQQRSIKQKGIKISSSYYCYRRPNHKTKL